MPPIIKEYDMAAPAALSTDVALTDPTTGLAFQRVNVPNAILDIINNPDPAAGKNYFFEIAKNGVKTGRRVFSVGISAASAGRMAVGPLGLSPGDYQYIGQQVLGALTATAIAVKYASSF